jgi:hypothetical protein
MRWYLDGKEDKSQIGNKYEFRSTITGNHTIGVMVKDSTGKIYNTNITIKVE